MYIHTYKFTHTHTHTHICSDSVLKISYKPSPGLNPLSISSHLLFPTILQGRFIKTILQMRKQRLTLLVSKWQSQDLNLAFSDSRARALNQ